MIDANGGGDDRDDDRSDSDESYVVVPNEYQAQAAVPSRDIGQRIAPLFGRDVGFRV